MKIKNRKNQYELEIKRFYFPASIEAECPACRAAAVFDGEEEYVSNPTLGAPTDIHFYCESCDHEWDEQVVFTLTVGPVT